jgi:hypothetical protein
LRQTSPSQGGTATVPMYTLQDAINSLDEIIEEEVTGNALGSMEQLFSSAILDDVTRQVNIIVNDKSPVSCVSCIW